MSGDDDDNRAPVALAVVVIVLAVVIGAVFIGALAWTFMTVFVALVEQIGGWYEGTTAR